MMTRPLDLTGQRIGKLLVLRRAEPPYPRKNTWFLCKCDCGNEKIVMGYYLNKGKTLSCGCLHKESVTSHGKSQTKLYKRIKAAGRKAWINRAEGHHSVQDIEDLYNLQEGQCYYCGMGVGQRYHIDHKTPLCRGGSNGRENLCVSCPKCNMEKKTKTEEEYVRFINSEHVSEG